VDHGEHADGRQWVLVPVVGGDDLLGEAVPVEYQVRLVGVTADELFCCTPATAERAAEATMRPMLNDVCMTGTPLFESALMRGTTARGRVARRGE
jgi:hypothetical protein